jgi:hypothetical protein
MEKTDPPRTDEVARLAEVERLALAERERRIDEAVERGEVVRVPLNVVCAAEDDLEEARIRERADKVSELRRAGEQRKPAFDEQVFLTGVGRPSRDDRYAERLRAERAQQTIEQRLQEEAEAAAQVEAYHEGSRSHEPEPPPAPMPVPIDVVPADDLEWRGIVVQMTGPTNGFAVSTRDAIRVLYVRNDAGSHIDTRLLHEGEDAKTIARSLLRDHYMKRHNSFYDPVSYPEKSIY